MGSVRPARRRHAGSSRDANGRAYGGQVRPAAVLSVTLLLLLGCSAGTAPVAPPPMTAAPGEAAIPGLVLTPGLQPSHVEGPISYDQLPPVGGAHNPTWARCEVYNSPVPAEFAVHSLEHGAVWLTYGQDLPAAGVQRLAALHELDDTTREYVLVSPYEGLPSPVVAAAWGVSLAVDYADDPRLEQFVRRFAGRPQGGEPGAPCTAASNAVTAEQARALLAQQE